MRDNPTNLTFALVTAVMKVGEQQYSIISFSKYFVVGRIANDA